MPLPGRGHRGSEKGDSTMASKTIELQRAPVGTAEPDRATVAEVQPRFGTATELSQRVQRQPRVFLAAGLLLLAGGVVAWWGARRPLAGLARPGAARSGEAASGRGAGALKRLVWTGLLAAASALASQAARRLSGLAWERAFHEAPPRA